MQNQGTRPLDRKRRSRGFTLLEVLVALTITGLALGALLSVIGGNKRLAWRSEAALQEAARVRLEINLAQLADTRGELPRLSPAQDLRLQQDLALPTPERKTAPVQATLRGYEVRNARGEVLTHGVHWAPLAVPE